MEHIKRLRTTEMADDEESIDETLPTVSLEDAQNAMKQLKIFALANAQVCSKLLECTVEMCSAFVGLTRKLQKYKQIKIYDYFANKLLVSPINLFFFLTLYTKGISYACVEFMIVLLKQYLVSSS